MGARHPLANCGECPLNLDSNAFVPSEGLDRDVKLAVVGEAPGYGEAKAGRPFIGQSGQLLDLVLKNNGLERKDVFYTNTCLCRPPDNTTPPKAAVAACKDRLISELQSCGASVVLALGSTSSEALLPGRGTITTLRVGPPKSSPFLGETKVIPTWHPAYTLRNADAFPTMQTDIAKIRDTDLPPWQAPDWKAFEDPEEALEVIRILNQYEHLVIDIECGIEKDTSYDHPNRYQMLCVGIAYADKKAVVIGEQAYQDERVRTALANLFRRKKLIAHNGKFDLAGLYPTLGPLELWFDTMLASYVCDERTGTRLHGLEIQSIEKLSSPGWKNEIDKYLTKDKNYANIPRPILYRYNAYDICNTWDLFEYYTKRLEEPPANWPYAEIPIKNRRWLHDFLVRASNQLMYLELNGITIDKEYNRELTIEYLEILNELEEQLSRVAFPNDPEASINPRSPKQVKTWLNEHDVNVAATDIDTLTPVRRRLAADSQQAQFIDQLLTQRKENKLFTTYVKGYTTRLYGGRVFTTYKLIGTTSGRLASANPNLQNVVRNTRIKKQFVVSKPGNIFVHADYSQVEGRCITYLAQDEYLRSIFADETRDIFNELGSQLYRVAPETLTKTQRVRTKAFFYGIGYGREAYSIAAEHNIPVKEAQRLYDDFMALIPATAAWQQDVRQQVLNSQPLVSPFGRHRNFYLITEKNKKDVLNEALSFLPQSTASDICLSALIRLRPMLKGKAFIRLTIHDALVCETSEELREEVATTMQKVMIEEGANFTDYVPFRVDVTYGKSWGEL